MSKRTIPRVPRPCAICGTQFLANKYAVARGKGLYCSPKCRARGPRSKGWKMNRKRLPYAELFWRNVAHGDPGVCWPWTGAHKAKGYGNFSHGRTTRCSHRIAWELARWPIPCGMYVCHRCDNPPCCNPGHLFLGTQKDNLADMAAKGRRAKPGPRIMKPEVVSRALELLSGGVRVADVARTLGVSWQSVGKVRRVHTTCTVGSGTTKRPE